MELKIALQQRMPSEIAVAAPAACLPKRKTANKVRIRAAAGTITFSRFDAGANGVLLADGAKPLSTIPLIFVV